jgi:ABC-2 type transport system ATP-binding protein
MEQVEEICDQIVLVNKGQKILDGSVKEVKQQFKQNLFKIGLDSNTSPGNSNVFEVIKENEDHSLIVKIQQGYTPNDVLLHYINQNIPIHSFQEILPSLNEIFIQLVEGTPAARQFQHIPA